MKKSRVVFFLVSVLLMHTSGSFSSPSMLNPISLIFDSGTTTFAVSESGTANYVASVNSAVPAAAALDLSLQSLGASPELTATQITTGASPCINSSTLCGSTFSLIGGQSCCLAFTLTSSASGRQVLQPIIGTTPAVYQAQAPSAESIEVTTTTTYASLSVSPTSLSLTQYNTTPSCVTVTNLSSTNAVLGLMATITPQNSQVTGNATGSTCTSTLPVNATCTFCFLPGAQLETGTQATFSGSNSSNSAVVQISVVAPPSTTLTTSLPSSNTLALSVQDTATNSALTGNPRFFTITNSGNVTAYNVTFSATQSQSNPSIISSTSSSSSCGNILPSDSCTLTITPLNATPTTQPYSPYPTPIILTIQGDNTNTLSPIINILTYGNIYQEGYIYAIDDTTPPNGSIGGSILTLTELYFNIYWDSLTQIITNAMSLTDGITNTISIIQAQGTGGIEYAAELCSTYSIDSSGTTPCNTGTCYSGWYLPAICEMGAVGEGASCSVGTQNIADNLSALIGFNQSSCSVSANCLAGLYWSSTEAFPPRAQDDAWAQQWLPPPDGNLQVQIFKDTGLVYLRCARALTP